ncbi:MAG: tripartite tricarboxylate transporter TctB family protein [Desulfarculaceae bacterium]|nr:tripartite tricarboxylate transporter TctB family protein [Desulfarculaceae bacterium]MCF8073186.1 tripartite tricarboxylate transporter TctB family protein [Desulfarculaceae bacterium]MCF8100782.1 tripartite tricarboxylate transporter TctB family protein [Desulfarculaceae bacterium]MCF8118429.1 tripartite tricarboxylate transporter TctB family protein [Desulfarculaceae bacterium]
MIANRKDFKLGLGLVAFCLLLLLLVIPYQVGPLTEADALMPVLVTCFIMLLSILLTIQAVRRAPKPGEHAEKAAPEHRSPWWSILIVIIIMAAYAWLLDLTGFVLTSLGAMIALFLVFGVRRWFPITAITLGTLGGLYLCFDVILGAPLPVGTLVENFLE